MHNELRSGISLWQASGEPCLRADRLEGDTRCEVAIVGAGITGALIADSLSRDGVDVVLVDKGAIGAGSTAASTGLLQYEIDTPLVDLIAKIGEASAVRAYRRGLRAIDELEKLAADLGAGCEFARRTTLCLASRQQDLPELYREYECRRHFGFDVSFLSQELLADQFGITAPGALNSRGDAEVNPYALTQRLVQRSRENGTRIFEQLAIEAVCATPSGASLLSAAGRIEARAAVLATGYSARPFLPDSLVSLQTTYVVASQPVAAIPNWPDRCLIWETARPYFYARQTLDGRVMLGGEDTPFADDHQEPGFLAQKAVLLECRFREMFPEADFRQACVWGGTFAETADGLPYIGCPRGSDSVYFALGYGGNGITFSMIAATLLKDLISGRPNEDAAIFGFNR